MRRCVTGGATMRALAALHIVQDDHPGRFRCLGGNVMVLIAVYLVFVLIGDVVAVGIAEIVESYVSKGASLLAFFVLFFFVFWVGWQLALRVTAPLVNKT
jgi:hypothetical protein